MEQNQTNMVANKSCEIQEKPSHPYLTSFYIIIFLVGLILNSFTLWFHCHQSHVQSSKSWMIYLKHLTVADFLICLSLPLRIVYYSDKSSFQLYCIVIRPLMFLNISASILFMGYIAASRYMKIFYSSRTPFLMTAKASHIISMTTWCFLLIVFIPNFTKKMVNYKSSNYTTCNEMRKNHLEISIRLILASASTFIFLLVFFPLMFFYYSTCSKVQQIQQSHLRNSEKLVNSRRKMLVLVSVFCICFVPYHVLRLPYIIFEGHCITIFYKVKEITVLLTTFNLCLDPIIYVFLCKNFRAQLNLKRIFGTNGNSNTYTLDARHSGELLNTHSSRVLEGRVTTS
ncbi:P2Y purinoceptor 14-like [Cyprinodon tularosa]|uniref:P2Y purinoceptor 14-like n=1 Tax=Cyprinodon tularosa TaxID=77115 RepID=UPI0018E2080F|nr:P2Y purinoceptor 14-like [Cyprinodon tularosa]